MGIVGHNNEVILMEVTATPRAWHSKTTKNLEDLHNPIVRPPNKKGCHAVLRATCSLREKSASSRARDLERRVHLDVDVLKNLDLSKSQDGERGSAVKRMHPRQRVRRRPESETSGANDSQR